MNWFVIVKRVCCDGHNFTSPKVPLLTGNIICFVTVKSDGFALLFPPQQHVVSMRKANESTKGFDRVTCDWKDGTLTRARLSAAWLL